MKKRFAIWGLLLLTVAMLAGCAEQTTPPAEEAAAEPVPEPVVEEVVPAAFEMTPELEAVLAKADLVDGTEDKVVALCPACALGMDGSAEHAANAGDYTLHFCTEQCKDAFSENLTASLMAMALPEVEVPTEQ
jgi:hypothetical protein